MINNKLSLKFKLTGKIKRNEKRKYMRDEKVGEGRGEWEEKGGKGKEKNKKKKKKRGRKKI